MLKTFAQIVIIVTLCLAAIAVMVMMARGLA
jgi:hypothetical protein